MRIRTLFLFLVSLSILDANDSLITSENEPSCLVAGKVNAITGKWSLGKVDLVIEGAEPIKLRRVFIESEGIWSIFPTLKMEGDSYIDHKGKSYILLENTGALVKYKKTDEKKIIGNEEFGKFVPVDLERGYTNTSRGTISSRTNLKNNVLYVGYKAKKFILHCADGTIRTFLKVHHGYGTYELESEQLPNGNWVMYDYEKVGKDKSQTTRLHSIRTTNPSREIVYAEAKIIYKHKDLDKSDFSIIGSDGKKAEYTFKRETLIHVNSSDRHDTSFEYQEFTNPIYAQKTIKEIRLPRDRKLKADFYFTKTTSVNGHPVEMINTPHINPYNGEVTEDIDADPRCGRIMTLSSPVGKDQSLHVTHAFLYDYANRKSTVYDAKNRRVEYHWDDTSRLKTIESYDEEGKLEKGEHFRWSHIGFLLSKRLTSYDGSTIWAKKYSYNSVGDILEERIYGNLSGEGPDILIGNDGLPLDNGVESYARRYTYTTGTRGNVSLVKTIEEDNGTKIEKTYLPQTDLVTSQTTFNHGEVKEEKFWEYDQNHLLIKETIRTKTAHLVKKITPKTSEPYFGLPHIIEEKYVHEGTEHLIRKTINHYGPRAQIQKKEIYDSNDNFCYELTYKYDDKGHLIEETNPLGQKARHTYDELGNRTSTQHFSGRLKSLYHYDFSNRLIKQEDKGDDEVFQSHHYEYDSNHHLISETDRYGNKITYVPNRQGSSKEIHSPQLTDENGATIPSVTYFAYDSAGNEIQKKDPAGNITQTQYNAYGKPIKITFADGAIETFTYDLSGRLINRTDPIGVISTYEHDYLGRICKKVTGNATEIYEYTDNYLTEKTDAEKNVTLYTYDSAGRKTSEECSGEKTFFTYDSLNRLSTTRQGDLLSIKKYNFLDQIIEERSEDLSGEILRMIKFEYDSAGNQKAVIRYLNGKEEREEYDYDSVNRLIEKRDALNYIQTTYYDPDKNQKTHMDQMGLETIETFNSRNLISSIEKRKSFRTLSTLKNYYGPTGQLSLQVSIAHTPHMQEKETRTRREYNSKDQLKTLTEAVDTSNAKTTHYQYSPRGELQTLTKPSGITLSYQYNDLGHLISLTSSDGTVNHQMEYNLLGHLQKTDQIVRTTDHLGRILSETFPQGYTIQKTYDHQGRKKKITLPEADTLIIYDYNAKDLKKVHRKKLDETPLYTHTYLSYDLSGNLLEEELIDSTKVHYSIDPLSRRDATTSPHFNQKILSFDPVGNIHKMLIQSDEVAYTYDDLYQLTSESGLFAHQYQYDSHYNRLQKDDETYQTNELHQLISHLEYDPNGNPIRQNDTTYTYDALDRLITIQNPNFTQTFTYDSLHRCISKTTYQGTQYFLYDDQLEIGSFDKWLNPLELRILGSTPYGETGSAIAIEIQSQIYVPLHDLQRNIAALVPTHTISLFPWFIESPTYYRYSAFGEEQITGSAQNPWRYASKRTDSDSKLTFFGRRYYDPTLGRWLTPDPIESTSNLYLYLNNNPLIFLDSFGLYTSDVVSDIHYFDRNNPVASNFSVGSKGDPENGTIHYHCGINNSRSDVEGVLDNRYNLFDQKYAIQGHWIHDEGMIRGVALVLAEKSRKNFALGPITNILCDFFLRNSYMAEVIKYETKLLSSIADEIISKENPLVKQVHEIFSNSSYPFREALKNLTPAQRDTIILISNGPTTLIESNLAHRVYNVIGSKDIHSMVISGVLIRNKGANVEKIEQSETKPVVFGHYATQPEYSRFLKTTVNEIREYYEIY